MASSNVELVRAIYEDGWAKGDFSSTAWADPEIELVLVDGIERNTYNGLDAVSKGWGDFLRVWEGLRAVPEEYRELDDGRILVMLHNSGRGKVSGLEVETISQRSVNLFELRKGKVTRIEAYWAAEGALERLGIDPSAASD